MIGADQAEVVDVSDGQPRRLEGKSQAGGEQGESHANLERFHIGKSSSELRENVKQRTW